MTEEDEAPPAIEDDDAEALRGLLRGAIDDPAAQPPDLLRGFQRKIRTRSRGKFFADGWSTSREPPTATYLLTTLLMLAIVLVVWAVLGPLAGAPVEVAPPAPVNIVAPR